jgi:trk system potassium uptake protein TrkH
MIVLVGGGIYSTTGGFKIYRVSAMGIHSARELNQLIYPSQCHQASDFGRYLIDENSMRAIWTYFSLSLLVIACVRNGIYASTATDFEGWSYHGDRVVFQCGAGL